MQVKVKYSQFHLYFLVCYHLLFQEERPMFSIADKMTVVPRNPFNKSSQKIQTWGAISTIATTTML